MTRDHTSLILDILRREVVPALGCTEPVAVALATAISTRELGTIPEKIEVLVSANLYKNGMGVMVPGTGASGLDIAAAAGALGGKPELELEVLRDITPDIAAAARQMLQEGRVSVRLADTDKILYAESTVSSGQESARTVIADGHANVVRKEKNGKTIFAAGDNTAKSPENTPHEEWPLSLSTIWDFAANPPPGAVDLIRETIRLNAAAGDEGLLGDYGLQVGKSLAPSEDDLLGDAAAAYAVRLTAAGSDVRMDGAMMPVMSNSGSGNQGIACTLPVLAIARRIKADDDRLIQAMLVSHLTSIHIKHFVGKLSALCGAMTASTGAACGLVCLLGGDVSAMGRAIRNMTGDLAGMICDGAKFTCSLKIASTTNAAIQAARLALKNHAPGSDNGICDDDAESAILHLAKLATEGMKQTDKVILDIMIDKKERMTSHTR